MSTHTNSPGQPQEAKTESVPFDPFADTTSASEVLEFPTTETAHLPEKSEKKKKKLRSKLSKESQEKALSTFKERKNTRRKGATAARGMVNLPFIQPLDPLSALLNPEEIAASSKKSDITLQPGEIVAHQYEILGPIAHGGQGWIYLAKDRNVSNRWVVLKGIAGKNNAKNRLAVDSERAFLAEITDPGIVKIYNFTEVDNTGYIIMEYVGGPSLRDVRKEQGTLSPTTAIGYILKILPALDYLHSRGVVYNDLKPDNIIITEDQVKLLDLGAVTGIGAYGHIYGTKGFQAPEIAQTGPSIESDLYTVGRTLASLIIDLPVEDGSFAPGLPSPEDEPLFRQSFSLFRFLERATHPDPAQRFHSVEDMRVQLSGILREILALKERRFFPHVDSWFSAQRSTFGTKHLVFRTDQLVDGVQRTVEITPPELVSALPVPLTDQFDPGSNLLTASSYTEPSEMLETLENALSQEEFADSAEIPLSIARAQLDLGLAQEAQESLIELRATMEDDWRRIWYSGVTHLLLENYIGALEDFGRLYTLLPGEPAPKLALAATAELLLQTQGLNEKAVLDDDQIKMLAQVGSNSLVPATLEMTPDLIGAMDAWPMGAMSPHALRFLAARLYAQVWATNPTTVSSAFGLSRQLFAEGLVNQAVAVLNEVPASSRYHSLAQLTSVIMLISGDASTLTRSRILRAGRRLDILPTSEPRLPQLQVAVLSAALQWLRLAKTADPATAAQMGPLPEEDDTIFGYSFTEEGLRGGLAVTLRAVAKQAPFPKHKYELVDMANKIRPRTVF